MARVKDSSVLIDGKKAFAEMVQISPRGSFVIPAEVRHSFFASDEIGSNRLQSICMGEGRIAFFSSHARIVNANPDNALEFFREMSLIRSMTVDTAGRLYLDDMILAESNIAPTRSDTTCLLLAYGPRMELWGEEFWKQQAEIARSELNLENLNVGEPVFANDTTAQSA